MALMVAAGLLYSNLGDKMGGEMLPQTNSGQEEETDQPAEEETKEESDYAAPDFTVYDKDGNAVSLSDFEGTPVVLNFWASWCGPCKSEMPAFNEVFLECEDTMNVEFMMVNLTDGMRETQAKAMRFVDDGGYEFPVYYDIDKDAMRTYGVQSVPITYFINEDGDLVTYIMGTLDADTLKKGIEMSMTTVIE